MDLFSPHFHFPQSILQQQLGIGALLLKWSPALPLSRRAVLKG